MKKEKRYQECNWLEKQWRKLWYLTIPFEWTFHSIFGTFKIYHDEWQEESLVHTEKYHVSRGKELWRLLVSLTHSRMKRYYTMEEVEERLKLHLNK